MHTLRPKCHQTWGGKACPVLPGTACPVLPGPACSVLPGTSTQNGFGERLGKRFCCFVRIFFRCFFFLKKIFFLFSSGSFVPTVTRAACVIKCWIIRGSSVLVQVLCLKVGHCWGRTPLSIVSNIPCCCVAGRVTRKRKFHFCDSNDLDSEKLAENGQWTGNQDDSVSDNMYPAVRAETQMPMTWLVWSLQSCFGTWIHFLRSLTGLCPESRKDNWIQFFSVWDKWQDKWLLIADIFLVIRIHCSCQKLFSPMRHENESRTRTLDLFPTMKQKIKEVFSKENKTAFWQAKGTEWNTYWQKLLFQFRKILAVGKSDRFQCHFWWNVTSCILQDDTTLSLFSSEFPLTDISACQYHISSALSFKVDRHLLPLWKTTSFLTSTKGKANCASAAGSTLSCTKVSWSCFCFAFLKSNNNDKKPDEVSEFSQKEPSPMCDLQRFALRAKGTPNTTLNGEVTALRYATLFFQ